MGKWIVILGSLGLALLGLWMTAAPLLSPTLAVQNAKQQIVSPALRGSPGAQEERSDSAHRCDTRAGTCSQAGHSSTAGAKGDASDRQAEKSAAWTAYERMLAGQGVSEEEQTLIVKWGLGPIYPRPSELDDIGGPDSFRYRYVDNLNGDTATFDWIELRGDPLATWLDSAAWTDHDRGYSRSPIQIGFPFPFYGAWHTQIWVNANSPITFGYSYQGDVVSCLPSLLGGLTILPFQSNLHLDQGGIPSGAGVVGYRLIGNRFILEYDSIGFYSMPGGGSLKFETILFPDGRIKLQYHTVAVAPGSETVGTVGIQQSRNGAYLQYRCQGQAERPLVSGRAIWFYLPPEFEHDFACRAITRPYNASCDPGSQITVAANVINWGTTAERATIHYQFANRPTVTESTAELPRWGTESHTFTTTLDAPTELGDYPLTVWTEVAGDGDSTNDRQTRTIRVRECPDVVLGSPMLPYTIANQTTCGMFNDVSATCLGLFDEGEDAIIEWTVIAEGDYDIVLNRYGSTATGLLIDDNCPPDGSCVAWRRGGTGPIQSIRNVHLAPGTYYIQVDAASDPGCIPLYDLTIQRAMPITPDFALTAPGWVWGNTCYAGNDCDLRPTEEQLVAVTIPVAGQWTFTLCQSRPEWDTYLYLTDELCGDTALAYNDDYYGLLSVIWCYPIPAPGVYYVDIEGYSSCGSWRLNVCDCATPRGRCCYQDTLGPRCMRTSQPVCSVLAGQWTEGMTCSDACVPMPACPDSSILSQPVNAPNENWRWVVSDLGDPSLSLLYEDFSGLTEPIGAVCFWGLALLNSPYPYGCIADTMPFEVKFFSDTVGVPQTEVATYTANVSPVYADVQYGNHQSGLFMNDVYQFTVVLDPALVLPAGWVSVRGANDSTCWFRWMSSGSGNGSSYRFSESVWREMSNDWSLCFVSGRCDSVTDLTAYCLPGETLGIRLRFAAPQTGAYDVYSTTEMNNDGDPRNGDPDWTLDATIAAIPGVVVWVDSTVSVPYKNYVVIHRCQW